MAKQKFLIVDDSSVVRKVSRRMLEELGFDVIEAEDGLQALQECEKHSPDAILLDWNMPVMDGLAFLESYRKTYGNEKKVIFCTTENDIAKIQVAIAAGADEYIMKPFDAEILKTKLIQAGIL